MDRARVATVSVLLLLVLVAIGLRSGPTTAAADSDALAWGASDPSWSPDGKRLSFSLFGSIWTVDPNGGVATQLSSSKGFHEHPAWSPDGASVAYIVGQNPRGRFAKVGGKLAIIDADTGPERVLDLPYVTAGTPAWSHDGTNIFGSISEMYAFCS